MPSVFYSWQSDLPERTNRSFIKDALSRAIKTLGKELPIEDAQRNTLSLDHDTKNVPGMPEITKTILEKISNCSVFVPDLTTVGTTGATDPRRPLQNPNVLIELGYAFSVLPYERIMAVVNEQFGSAIDTMPFNLRHRRAPIAYSLSADATLEERTSQRRRLERQFLYALRNLVSDGLLDIQPSDASLFQMAESKWRAGSFLETGDEITKLRVRDEWAQEIYKPVLWENGPLTFLRVIPTKVTLPRLGGYATKRDNALGGIHGKETKELQSGVQG